MSFFGILISHRVRSHNYIHCITLTNTLLRWVNSMVLPLFLFYSFCVFFSPSFCYADLVRICNMVFCLIQRSLMRSDNFLMNTLIGWVLQVTSCFISEWWPGLCISYIEVFPITSKQCKDVAQKCDVKQSLCNGAEEAVWPSSSKDLWHWGLPCSTFSLSTPWFAATQYLGFTAWFLRLLISFVWDCALLLSVQEGQPCHLEMQALGVKWQSFCSSLLQLCLPDAVQPMISYFWQE